MQKFAYEVRVTRYPTQPNPLFRVYFQNQPNPCYIESVPNPTRAII